MVDSDSFFVFYLAIFLIPLTVFWIGSLWRDRILRAPSAPRVLFRCAECICFYQGDPGTTKSPCPTCGRQNERLKL